MRDRDELNLTEIYPGIPDRASMRILLDLIKQGHAEDVAKTWLRGAAYWGAIDILNLNHAQAVELAFDDTVTKIIDMIKIEARFE